MPTCHGLRLDCCRCCGGFSFHSGLGCSCRRRWPHTLGGRLRLTAGVVASKGRGRGHNEVGTPSSSSSLHNTQTDLSPWPRLTLTTKLQQVSKQQWNISCKDSRRGIVQSMGGRVDSNVVLGGHQKALPTPPSLLPSLGQGESDCTAQVIPREEPMPYARTSVSVSRLRKDCCTSLPKSHSGLLPKSLALQVAEPRMLACLGRTRPSKA